jgi:hypothetical protein
MPAVVSVRQIVAIVSGTVVLVDGLFQKPQGREALDPLDAKGTALARMESRHVHGVGADSRGNIYAGLTQHRSVDKFVRTSSAPTCPS